MSIKKENKNIERNKGIDIMNKKISTDDITFYPPFTYIQDVMNCLFSMQGYENNELGKHILENKENLFSASLQAVAMVNKDYIDTPITVKEIIDQAYSDFCDCELCFQYEMEEEYQAMIEEGKAYQCRGRNYYFD